MIIGVNEIIICYEFFYQKKYNSNKYRFKPPSQAIVKIQAFLKELDKRYDLNTLGSVFLTTYFMFQFNRTHNQVFNRFASRFKTGEMKVGGRIQIYDVIGKKALKYWLDRDINFDFVLQNSDFAKQHKVSYLEVRSLLDKPPIKNSKSIIQAEEIEKSRFLNKARGLLNCIERTTLYNHRSYNCISCKEKITCKKLLESNYNHIFIERGYGK